MKKLIVTLAVLLSLAAGLALGVALIPSWKRALRIFLLEGPFSEDTGYKQELAKDLRQYKPEDLPIIKAILADQDRIARVWMLQSISGYGEDGAALADDVAVFLGDPEPALRENAAYALAGLGPEVIAPRLAKLLALADRDPEPRVRVAALHAIGEHRGRLTPAILAPLLKGLAADEPRLRDQAERSLGEFAPAPQELLLALENWEGSTPKQKAALEKAIAVLDPKASGR